MVGIALLSASGYSQVSPTAKGYLFRLLLKTNQRLAYEAPVVITGVPNQPPIRLRMRLSLRVLSAKRMNYRVRAHMDPATYQGTPLMEAQTAMLVVNNRGQVKSAHTGLVGFCVAFPLQPVKLGGSFVSKVPIPLGMGLGQGVGSEDATFKLVGFSGAGSRRVARLTYTVAGAKAPGGSLLISLKDGTLVKYYTKFSAQVGPGSAMLVTATFLRK